jgi:hypothetical protein
VTSPARLIGAASKAVRAKFQSQSAKLESAYPQLRTLQRIAVSINCHLMDPTPVGEMILFRIDAGLSNGIPLEYATLAKLYEEDGKRAVERIFRVTAMVQEPAPRPRYDASGVSGITMSMSTPFFTNAQQISGMVQTAAYATGMVSSAVTPGGWMTSSALFGNPPPKWPP